MGSIEVIVGGMYSGKTEELIRRLRRATFAKQNIALFKPSIDDRYSTTEVVSHIGDRLESQVIEDPYQALELCGDAKVVGFDEAQFFGLSLPDIATEMADVRGIRVILAGLDMDWKRNPWEPMVHLMAIAEKVTKLQAICVQCGKEAGFTFRTQPILDKIQVGSHDFYEARCRSCYLQGMSTT